MSPYTAGDGSMYIAQKTTRVIAVDPKSGLLQQSVNIVLKISYLLIIRNHPVSTCPFLMLLTSNCHSIKSRAIPRPAVQVRQAVRSWLDAPSKFSIYFIFSVSNSLIS